MVVGGLRMVKTLLTALLTDGLVILGKSGNALSEITTWFAGVALPTDGVARAERMLDIAHQRVDGYIEKGILVIIIGHFEDK